MKNFKRIFAIFMVMIMALALVAPAAADIIPLAAGTGSITITKATVGQTYHIYHLAELMSYDTVANSYSYKVVPEWIPFFTSQGILVDSNGYIYGTNTIQNNQYAAFASAALEYVKAYNTSNPQNPIKECAEPAVGNEQTQTAVFSNLNYGYYLIDSTVGTLCTIGTFDGEHVTFEDKNDVPTIVKKVQENSTGTYGTLNDAPINSEIKFVIQIAVKQGAENYIFADTMSSGLTLDNFVKCEYKEGSSDPVSVAYTAVRKYKEDGTVLSDEEYKAALDLAFGAENYEWEKFKTSTFAVKLDEATLQNYVGKTITFGYTAHLNKNAVIAGDGNPNAVTLYYGEKPFLNTTESKTTTYTWDFSVFKYTGNNSPVAGAGFKFYVNKTVQGEATPIYLNFARIADTVVNGESIPTYRADAIPKAGETYITGGEIFTTVADNGKFRIVGLDSDTIYLEETTTPPAYNPLTSAIAITITDNIVGNSRETATQMTHSVSPTTDGYVKVLNSGTTTLPTTGSAGTIIFIAVGSFLVVLMGMLLVVKKRMTKITYIDR